MELTELLLMATAALLLLGLLLRKPRNFPPGPLSLPLVGSLPAMSLVPATTPHEAMWALARRHGPVLGLFLGPQPAVIVSGYQAVKHVLGRDDLALRPDVVPIHANFYNQRLSLLFTGGNQWKEQRRFTLHHLRDFGFGRQTMEALIQEEAGVLVEAVEAEVNASPEQRKIGVDLLHIFPVLAINMLWIIMAGERHELTDERFNKITHAVIDFFRSENQLSLVGLFPILQKIPIINSHFLQQLNIAKDFRNFVEKTIEEHNATYDASSMRDFIDVYIREMKSQHQTGAESTFTRSQLSMVCMDLFSAGTETTASTLGYCLRYMVQRPDVQDKLRAEVLRVVGSERLPSMNDMPKLHYAQAVLHEVLRHSGLSPFTPPHATNSKTEILGHQIPKGTLIMINLWSVHMDPDIWVDPENFRPERFIAEDGTFQIDKHLMLFGYGPRICLGESLARNSTFVFFTSLVQRFQFHVPSYGSPPSNEQMQGFTTSPAPFFVAVTSVKDGS